MGMTMTLLHVVSEKGCIQ